MSRNLRIVIALAAVLVIAGLVLGVDWLQRYQAAQVVSTSTPLPPGSIPIVYNGQIVAGFLPTDLEKLTLVSFVDAEEGKTQDGWLLRDVLLLVLKPEQLPDEAQITVSSSSRDKSATLSWAKVKEASNMVMFDLSNRGTLKLVSLLPQLNTRNWWVQDVDRIEVVTAAP
jgi:hypothetical protein